VRRVSRDCIASAWPATGPAGRRPQHQAQTSARIAKRLGPAFHRRASRAASRRAAPQVIQQLEGFGQVTEEDQQHDLFVMDGVCPLRSCCAPQGRPMSTSTASILPFTPTARDEPAPVLPCAISPTCSAWLETQRPPGGR